jgi:hypothetical protein
MTISFLFNEVSASVAQPSSPKHTIKEFDLKKSQLAFTVGKKTLVEGIPTLIVFAYTTVFSDEMTETIRRDSDSDNAPTESTTVRSHSSKSSNCRMYKYAPRHGYADSNDEVLIFFTNKLRTKKYGGEIERFLIINMLFFFIDLQVTFQYTTPNVTWSESVLDLEVKEQMVSFRTPRFPFPIDDFTTVNVILKQKKRVLEPLTFNYTAISNKNLLFFTLFQITVFASSTMSTMSKKYDDKSQSK